MTRLHKPLIVAAQQVLEDDPRVVAAWLEGSIARGEDDDFSDIDLWIAVKDHRFHSFIAEREAFAAKIGPVVSVLYPKTSHQGDVLDSFSIFFADQPTTLVLDVDVQKESRKFWFTKDSAAEECQVLFDRGNVITFKPFNPQEVEDAVRTLFTDVTIRFWHDLPKLTKHLQREDFLDATRVYMDLWEYLVTLYRLMYAPEKAEWGFKDVEYDLPESAVKELYECAVPECSPKAFRKQQERLVKRFARVAKELGRRLRIAPPRQLHDYVLRNLSQ